MEYKYYVSVIVPVYNSAKYLPKCMDSLLGQGLGERMEILLVNDGSSDNSLDICNSFSDKHKNITVIDQPNQGVSAARNAGIKAARGKYIMFVDSDDSLSKNSVKNICDFFDCHYDETDLVTYPLAYDRGKGGNVTHFRYDILHKSGIYKLDEYPYISQTTVNICVKNKGDKNLLFDTGLFLAEDQLYVTENLKGLATIGYCADARYTYYLHGSNVSRTLNQPEYAFEQMVKYYTRLVECARQYPDMEQYIQCLLIYNFSFRFNKDELVPRSADKVREERQMSTLSQFASIIDDRLIMDHPDMSIGAKMFVLGLKPATKLSANLSDNTITLYNNETALLSEQETEITISRMSLTDSKFYIAGALTSPSIALFDNVSLSFSIDDSKRTPLELCQSSQSWFMTMHTHECKAFSFEAPSNFSKIRFDLQLNGRSFPVKLRYLVSSSYGSRHTSRSFICKDRALILSGDTVRITKKNDREARALFKEDNAVCKRRNKAVWLLRKLSFVNRRRRIWLYSDSSAHRGNAWLQFEHDRTIRDGITRYYISPQKPSRKDKNIIRHGHPLHLFIMPGVERVISSCSDSSDMIPFGLRPYAEYSGAIGLPAFVRMPCGVDCAQRPWIRARDSLFACREVISTDYEQQLFTGHYGMTDGSLIPSALPSFDTLATNTSNDRVILFAPSWRKYLVGKSKRKTTPLESRFSESVYYKETLSFLQSERLSELLDKYDYSLEFCLPLSMQFYSKLYPNNNSRIKVIEQSDHSNYSSLLTDFDSRLFDFLFMKKPVVGWRFDNDPLENGLHEFSDPGIPEHYYSALCKTCDDVLDALESLMQDKLETKHEQVEFLNRENCRKALYEAVSKL